MARLAPPDMMTEMFGLYAMTGKAIAFLGPLGFAVLTDLFDSQRAGMSIVLAFWVAGGALLLFVREPRRVTPA
jgi:MFS transporter, UMF1 family